MTLSLESEPLPLRRDEHGAIRVGKTRVLLEMVIGAYQQGYNPEEIVEQFTTLQLADVYAVIAYYLNHKDEVNAYLQQVEEEAVQIRQKLEARFDNTALYERLRAIRDKQEQHDQQTDNDTPSS